MATKVNDFRINTSALQLGSLTIPTTEIVECVAMTNQYLNELYELFFELDFDLFFILGQRNISGVIGEIFSRFLTVKFDHFHKNPHPDGRPDILCLLDETHRIHFHKECFQLAGEKLIPLKSKLAPFAHTGFEVKCTLGAPVANYRKKMPLEQRSKGLEIGMPRIDYLSQINYWAHHRHSSNFLGLYYDYYPSQNNRPQILSAFFAELVESDWNVVSTGSTTGKKTSATALNIAGVRKLYNGCLLLINDKKYIVKFQNIGITLNN